MSRDLRHYARQTNIQLVVGFILVLFVIGDGLIYVFLGRNAALMGLLCLAAAISPVVLIVIVLGAIDWVARRNR